MKWVLSTWFVRKSPWEIGGHIEYQRITAKYLTPMMMELYKATEDPAFKSATLEKDHVNDDDRSRSSDGSTEDQGLAGSG